MAHLGIARDSLFAAAVKWLRKATNRSRRLHHVFRGEVRRGQDGTWAAHGLHHRFMGEDLWSDRQVGPILRYGNHGTYSAVVSMRDPAGGRVPITKVSTFFPDHWHPRTVAEKIDEAFKNHIRISPTRWRGHTLDGMRVEGSFNAHNGKWNSAWPIVE